MKVLTLRCRKAKFMYAWNGNRSILNKEEGSSWELEAAYLSPLLLLRVQGSFGTVSVWKRIIPHGCGVCLYLWHILELYHKDC